MKKVAISVGDLNGVGIEIALLAHKEISKVCCPIYCINKKLLTQAAKLLKTDIPKDFELYPSKGNFTIRPGHTTKESGKFSYVSFMDAVTLAKKKKVDAIITLPIHKKAWQKADLHYVGHTDLLRDIFQSKAIMMLGSKKMFVALYTEHIPLKQVPKQIKVKKLSEFLHNLHKSLNDNESIAVLALNPHAGDNGVLGDEEIKISKALKKANEKLSKKIFQGPFVPDVAFTPNMRKKYKYFVAMYHDQGLAPLKALYFDESINVSLNLPIIRTSVDHGTAFDIAYKNKNPNTQSYINALYEAINLSKNRDS